MSWTVILAGLGMVLVIEGLVFALAPSRLDDIAKFLAQIPPETRRFIGLSAIAVGTLLVSWMAALG